MFYNLIRIIKWLKWLCIYVYIWFAYMHRTFALLYHVASPKFQTQKGGQFYDQTENPNKKESHFMNWGNMLLFCVVGWITRSYHKSFRRARYLLGHWNHDVLPFSAMVPNGCFWVAPHNFAFCSNLFGCRPTRQVLYTRYSSLCCRHDQFLDVSTHCITQ